MMKRLFIIFGLIVFISLSGYSSGAQYKLENEHILAVFDASNGSLVKLVNKKTNWNVIYREQLGQSFDMLVPLKWKRFHYVRGVDQTPPEINATADKITFTWNSLKSKLLDKPLNIKFIGEVTLTPDGLTYSGKVINNDTCFVEYVGWPYWGEVAVPDREKRFVFESINQGKMLHPSFQNEQGYWGADYPTQSITLPESAFLLMRNENEGITGISEQSVPQELIVASHELIPGYEYNNPVSDVMDGQMVRIQFKVNRLIFTAPETSRELVPFNLSFYEGSWHKGVDVYKAWKQKAMKQPEIADWMKEPYTWRCVSISNVQELVRLAQESKMHGVSVLHVNGWRAADSRDDIKAIDGLTSAIRECRQLGVKIVLDMHLNDADKNSPWYRDELKNYVITNLYGMTTDIRMLCPHTKELISITENKYAKNKDLSAADGVIIFDSNNNGHTFFCFDSNHGHKIPEFVQTGTFNLDRSFANEVRKAKPEIAVLGFGFFDAQTAIYDGYRMGNGFLRQEKHRYINTQTPIISVIEDRTAREDLNLCLKDKYTVCYNFSLFGRELDRYPLIVKYGREIESLRKKYKEFIWEGEFRDTQGARVEGDRLSYSVFQTGDGRKGLVIVNNGTDKASTAKVTVDQSKRSLIVASPENPESVAYNGSVSIEPLSAILVMEK
jgi:hypothetical protein